MSKTHGNNRDVLTPLTLFKKRFRFKKTFHSKITVFSKLKKQNPKHLSKKALVGTITHL